MAPTKRERSEAACLPKPSWNLPVTRKQTALLRKYEDWLKAPEEHKDFVEVFKETAFITHNGPILTRKNFNSLKSSVYAGDSAELRIPEVTEENIDELQNSVRNEEPENRGRKEESEDYGSQLTILTSAVPEDQKCSLMEVNEDYGSKLTVSQFSIQEEQKFSPVKVNEAPPKNDTPEELIISNGCPGNENGERRNVTRGMQEKNRMCESSNKTRVDRKRRQYNRPVKPRWFVAVLFDHLSQSIRLYAVYPTSNLLRTILSAPYHVYQNIRNP